MRAAPAAPTEVYQGLYFHSFTGAVDGSEWATWGPTTGDGRLELSDLPAGGTYRATVAPDGSFVLDNGNGTGSFTSDDDVVMDFTIPGFPFHSVMHRAPYTDSAFPVFLTQTVDGDAALTGAWRARVLDVNPVTGETISERRNEVDVLVSGTTVRVTDADGSWVQGVWMSGSQAGFRVIKPAPSKVRYRTFAGSDLSESLDLVGDLRVLDDGSMTLAAFFQTRAALGAQVQTMRYYELTRVPAPGGLGLLGIMGLAAARRAR